jgi:hypothetical protein
MRSTLALLDALALAVALVGFLVVVWIVARDLWR